MSDKQEELKIEEVTEKSKGVEGFVVESKSPMDAERVLSILESLLFASDKPLGLTVIKSVFEERYGLSTSAIKTHLKNLKRKYINKTSGLELVEVGGAYQIRTKVDNKEFVQSLVKAKSFRLSPAALEVLSIIAYKQPCIKSSVDEVRGVDSGHLVRALMDRSLVKFSGKSELPGKPMLYTTTDKFLEVFGLNKLVDLPNLSEIEELLPEDSLEVKKTDTLSIITDSLTEKQSCNDIQDQEELSKLSERLSGIEVTPEALKKKKEDMTDSAEA